MLSIYLTDKNNLQLFRQEWFKMCDFLNSGLKVKLKKLGQIDNKTSDNQHFLNKNCS